MDDPQLSRLARETCNVKRIERNRDNVEKKYKRTCPKKFLALVIEDGEDDGDRKLADTNQRTTIT